MQTELSDEGSEAVALIVREELARRRLSRQWLADEARVSLSTLEKALAGSRPFTLATVVRLEDALGTSLRGKKLSPETELRNFAPDSMGAYTRPAVQWLEGSYLTLRPSFSEAGAVFAYLTYYNRNRLHSTLKHRTPYEARVCYRPTIALAE